MYGSNLCQSQPFCNGIELAVKVCDILGQRFPKFDKVCFTPVV